MVEILKDSVIRVQSSMNEWMDCVFVVSKEDEEKAHEVLSKAWDKQRGVFVPIGRPVLAKQLCLNRYQERVRKGEIPSWIDPEKFKILERTVAEIASDWKEANDE